ncbi:MAG: catechol 2,3-dioxygenase [Gammaproteobacteria bacterium]|nr:catechol 2,3-dioxygenase [Gammaproteobacteria bacterium]
MRKGVMRPGHIQLRVLDLEEAVKHYTDVLGLIEMDRDDQGRVYLKAWTEVDKYSVILRQADEAGMDFVAYKCISEDVVDKLRDELEAFGCDIEELPAGELKDCGRRLRFAAPTGHHIEIFASKLQTGKWGVSDRNPEAWPRNLSGIKATRFDHCLLYGPNLDETLKLFRDVLGFELAEQVLTPDGKRIAQFLTISTKAHDVAFIEHPEPGKLHHVSFYLESWNDVLRAADLLTMTDTTIDVSPTRHGLTHGQTVYFFDTSGNRNEVFTGGDYHYPDHEPVTWDAEQVGKAIFYHDRQIKDTFLQVVT